MGTRLQGLLGSLPKVLAPLGGRTFLDWKIDELAGHGAGALVILAGQGVDQVRRHLLLNPPPMPVRVHEDGPRLLGTGGALVGAQLLLPEAFVVMYGDSLQAEPLKAFWADFHRAGLLGLVAVTRQLDSTGQGNIATADGRALRYEKGTSDAELGWLDYGYLALRREVLTWYSTGSQLDLGTVMTDLIAAQQLGIYPVSEGFLEIGTPDQLADVERMLEPRIQD
jgi:NDP-sugar pyrophosphorylase family protein